MQNNENTTLKELVRQKLKDSGDYTLDRMRLIVDGEIWFLGIESGFDTLDFVEKYQNDKLLEEFVDENCGMSVSEAINEAEQEYESMSEYDLLFSRDFDYACENLTISVNQTAIAYCQELFKELEKELKANVKKQ